MPKIIENLREQIVEEARRQLMEAGYSGTTVRSVAKACGIGTGTVYNYFDSKDALVSSLMLADWHECTGAMKRLDCTDKLAFLEGVYGLLAGFTDKYRFIFGDSSARAVYASVSDERHKQLRGVMAEILLPVCKGVKDVDERFLAEHLSQAFLTWAMERVPFSKQTALLKRLTEQSINGG